MAFQTEYEFELPRGFVDETGAVHRRGKMRLATAADEILPMKDPRVAQNPGYISIIIMSRVITQLGSLPAIDTRAVEKLFTADMAYLQDLYNRINAVEPLRFDVTCPHCGQSFRETVPFLED